MVCLSMPMPADPRRATEAICTLPVDWLRVVLDEAHTIKNRTSRGAKACYDLKSQRRWALTGNSP